MSIGRHTRKTLLYLGLSALVGTAIGLSGLRFWLLPEAARFRKPLESQIGDLVQAPIRIEQVAGRMHGWRPELVLRGLQILGENGAASIRFDDLRADIDPIASFIAGELVFSRFRIVGVHLSVLRRPDGSFTVAGLDSSGNDPKWPLIDGHFELRDCTLDFDDLRDDRPPLLIGKAQIHLHNEGERHQLNLVLDQPGNRNGQFRLISDIHGSFQRPEDWTGRFYLESRHANIGRLADGILPGAAVPVSDARAALHAWGDWNRGLERITGELGLDDIVFRRTPDTGLKSLASRFVLHRETAGFRLDLHGLRPIFRKAWPESELAIAWDLPTDNKGMKFRAAASFVDLGDLVPLTSYLPPSREAISLAELAPHGTLRNLRLFLQPESGPGENWGICGEVADFSTAGHHQMPAVSGVSGWICGNDRAGRLALEIRDGRLSAPGLGIENPRAVARGALPLTWEHAPDGWTWSTPGIALKNSDLRLYGRGSVQIPSASGQAPFLNMTARISDLDVTALKSYLPTRLIPATSAWIKESLIKGRITQADFLVHGPTAEFPFPSGQGVFQADIDTENLDMDFNREWLPLTGASLAVHLHGSGMDAESRRGRIGQGEILQAQAHVDDFERSPWLTIRGTVHAGVAASLDYLQHSPISRIPERLLRVAEVGGDAEIALDLAIPLEPRLGEARVEGTANLRDAALTLRDFGLTLDQIDGPLRFSGSGLHGSGIRARMLEKPVQLDIAKKRTVIDVGVTGQADVEALKKHLPQAAWQYASGAADYRLQLEIPDTLDAHSGPIRVELDSELRGLALDLPPPFDKPAQSRRSLAISGAYQSGAKIPLDVTYGAALRARLRFHPTDTWNLESGEIGIGQTPPPHSNDSGLGVAASLDRLDVDEWHRWIAASSAGSLGTTALSLRRMDLNTRNLRWNGRDFGPLGLALWRRENTWLADVSGRSAKGQIDVSSDALRLNFDYVKWPASTLSGTGKTSGPPTMPTALEPSNIPPVNLSVGKLYYQHGELGHLQLVTERQPQGMAIRTLNLTDDRHRLTLHGDWARENPTQAFTTRLEGKLRVEDLGRSLTPFGFGGEIRATPSDASFALNWPGAPHDFDKASVAGQVTVKLGKGAVNKVEPGLGRVLGMLNFDTIWRRLNLDFSDLFSPGLAYDHIAGTFKLGGGQAVTDDLMIDAVPAKILISGRAGLVTKDLDQTVTVIPHTTVALPIAGALAGGPAVGAAVLIAQQLVGDKIDTITATQYAIRGDWDNTKVTRIDRNLPLDVINKAWAGMKDLSGLGDKQEETQQ